jgi:hypothetical protein
MRAYDLNLHWPDFKFQTLKKHFNSGEDNETIFDVKYNNLWIFVWHFMPRIIWVYKTLKWAEREF